MKAILVIDIPHMCNECPLCHHDNECDIIGTVTDDDSVDLRCPLKPMPEKENTAFNGYNSYIMHYEEGWNDCIGTILGEFDIEV